MWNRTDFILATLCGLTDFELSQWVAAHSLVSVLLCGMRTMCQLALQDGVNWPCDDHAAGWRACRWQHCQSEGTSDWQGPILCDHPLLPHSNQSDPLGLKHTNKSWSSFHLTEFWMTWTISLTRQVSTCSTCSTWQNTEWPEQSH